MYVSGNTKNGSGKSLLIKESFDQKTNGYKRKYRQPRERSLPTAKETMFTAYVNRSGSPQ